MKIPKALVLSVLILGLANVFTACSKPADPIEEDPVIEENYVYGPLNHLKLDEQAQSEVLDRPIVVTIDNLSKARPQSGLAMADLMYELPAEGGISRYLAVFYCSSPDIVGPVRSARPYLVDVAKGYGGVYVHAGGSMDALSYLQKGSWPYINEFAYGSSFWRDKSRKAPHNLYTSIENLMEIITKKGWNEKIQPEALLFLEEGETVEGERAELVKINYPYARNLYTYDSQTGLYLRQVNESNHLDAVTEEQIYAANILVQKVKSKVLDSEGRLEINLVGEGEAILFSQGITRSGTWKRSSLNSRTVFTDALSGQEWKLFPGQTWIQVTDGTVSISYESLSGESQQDMEGKE